MSLTGEASGRPSTINTYSKLTVCWEGCFVTATSDDLFLKRGYHARSAATYFTDNVTDSDDVLQQPDVYRLAAELARHFESKWIIDVGCGRAEKLIQWASDIQIVGIDTGLNITYCREKYVLGTWLDVNLEYPGELPLTDEQVAGSVIVCNSVIEYLIDPRPLLFELARLRELAAAVIITSPDRDRAGGPDDIGPPGNPYHVREWNIDEMGRLLSFCGLEPIFLGYTMNNYADRQKNTSLAIIEGKQIPLLEKAPDDFRVLAVITAYNERDILPHTVKRLLDQGVEVVVLDNWSTDGTIDIIEAAFSSQVQVIRFPESDTGTYDWSLLLDQVEKIGRQSGADWVIHHDADEVREGPWLDMNLRDSIWNVQRRGFNAINHTVIEFRPVQGEIGVTDGSDPAECLLWWEEDAENHAQVKAWKNVGQAVNLAATGGHEIRFAGRRIFPYRFLLRHYPLRSPDHARRKIFMDRGARWNRKERSKGWHDHYDNFDRDEEFLWSKDDLHHWDPEEFHREFLVERLMSVGGLKRPPNFRSWRGSKLRELLAHSATLKKIRRATLKKLRKIRRRMSRRLSRPLWNLKGKKSVVVPAKVPANW